MKDEIVAMLSLDPKPSEKNRLNLLNPSYPHSVRDKSHLPLRIISCNGEEKSFQ